jgi:putative acetyltransferase
MAASPSSSIVIRSYQPSDLSICQTLLLDAHKDYGHPAEYHTHAFETDMVDIEKNYLQVPNAHWWVAVSTDDNHIVGQVAVQPLRLGDRVYYRQASVDERDQICELRRMAVAPNAQKRGIGSLLLSTVLDFARQHGYRQVHLTNLTNMGKACAFYEKHGFVKGRIDRYSLEQIARKQQEQQKNVFADYMSTPVVFEVGAVIPDEDQHQMKLPVTQSKFVYAQHFCRTL